jgi:hypothetical protein
MKQKVLFFVGLVAVLGFGFYGFEKAKKKARDKELILDDFNRYFYGELYQKMYSDSSLTEVQKRFIFQQQFEPNKRTFLRLRAKFLSDGNPGYEGVIFDPSLVESVLNGL